MTRKGLSIWREVIEHQPLPSAAVSALVRARLAGAEFRDLVTVYRRAGHFCAEFHFVEPIGPANQSSVIVMLGMVPDRAIAGLADVERGGAA